MAVAVVAVVIKRKLLCVSRSRDSNFKRPRVCVTNTRRCVALAGTVAFLDKVIAFCSCNVYGFFSQQLSLFLAASAPAFEIILSYLLLRLLQQQLLLLLLLLLCPLLLSLVVSLLLVVRCPVGLVLCPADLLLLLQLPSLLLQGLLKSLRGKKGTFQRRFALEENLSGRFRKAGKRGRHLILNRFSMRCSFALPVL